MVDFLFFVWFGCIEGEIVWVNFDELIVEVVELVGLLLGFCVVW